MIRLGHGAPPVAIAPDLVRGWTSGIPGLGRARDVAGPAAPLVTQRDR